MCLKPRRLTIRNVITGSARPQSVPCGKCMECLRRKQNDYAFIMSQHAMNHTKVDLVTLTYRNSAVPFSGVFEVFNKETGEVVDKSGIFWLKSEYHDSVVREYYSGDGASGHQLQVPTNYLDGLDVPTFEHHIGVYFGTETDIIYSPKSVYTNQGLGNLPEFADVRVMVTASLRRSDVKDALKVVRIQFKRKYGYSAKFTYFEVGEYGEKRHRPHYHIEFFDCPDEFLDMFRSYWYEHYGETDYEPVVAMPGDSLEQAFEKVSKYLSKYLAKGVFEKDFVKQGYVEKPRRISSKGIASDRLPFLRSYCLAFDVFGEYDPDNPPRMVMQHIDLLASRRYYSFSRDGVEYKIRIPKILYEKVMSKAYGLSKDDRKALGLCAPQSSSPVLRLSHWRTAVYRAVLSYTKKHFEDLLNQVVFTASRGKSLRPSSLSFRLAYASLSGSSQKVRALNSSNAWTQLRNFYLKSKDGQ